MPGSIMIQLKGITGACTETNHKKWVDVESVHLGVSNTSNIGTGTQKNRVPGATLLQDVSFARITDEASPQLMQAVAAGKNFDDVTVDMLRPDKVGMALREQYKFFNVVLTNWSPGTQGGQQGQEQISFNYVKVEYKYIPFDEAGKSGSPVTGAFDAGKAVVS